MQVFRDVVCKWKKILSLCAAAWTEVLEPSVKSHLNLHKMSIIGFFK